MNEIEQQVDGFLRSYRTAFEHLDVTGIGAHFAFPLHIAGDGEEVALKAIPSVTEWQPQLERLVDSYRTIGVRSAAVEQTSIHALSPRLIQVQVRWRLLDVAGAELYAFTTSYTLAQVHGDLRIVALAHDELPRFARASRNALEAVLRSHHRLTGTRVVTRAANDTRVP